MKILFLNTDLNYGGATKMLVWVANAAASAGHESVFLTYRESVCSHPLAHEVRHVHLPLEPDGGGGRGILNSVRVLRSFIIKEGFDLAVAFLTPSQLRLRLACHGLRTKLLFSHRGDPNVKSGGIGGLVSRMAFRGADYFVFQTPAALEYFGASVRDRGVVIPNPVPVLHRSCPRPLEPEKRIVCVARLDNVQKRQDLLIEAFRAVADKHPEYILELHGDGPDESMLRNLASDIPSVHFMGKTDNVAGSIENARLLVLSSDFEGIPNALAEGMSLGLPCVSTDCSPGGAAMLIKSGTNGLLVPRNDASGLAEAMTFMIENPEQAEAMGRKATGISDRFSEEKIRNMWLDYFAEIGRRIC